MEAMRESCRVSIHLLEAAKSSDRQQHRKMWKEWLAAQQRRRKAWLAMATPSAGMRGTTSEAVSSPGSR
jgi:hypothetical protein